MELPEIRNEVHMDHISGQPQGYALRILRYYRERCNEKWEVHGLSEGETLLYGLMNDHQDQRAAELDKAIAVLEGHATMRNQRGYRSGKADGAERHEVRP